MRGVAPPESGGVTRPLPRLAALALVSTLVAGGALPASAAVTAPAAPAAATRAAAPAAPVTKAAAAKRASAARRATAARRAKAARRARRSVHPAARPTAPRVAVPVTAAPTGTTVALSPVEARLVQLVNSTRASHGLKPLTVAAGATDVARRWSLALVRAGALSHNPRLVDDMQSAGSNAWTFLAENVGTGPADDADTLFAAYMASQHHRDNILDARAVYVGMGSVEVPGPDGPTLWNTMDFADAYAASYGPAHTTPAPTVVPLSQAAAALHAA